MYKKLTLHLLKKDWTIVKNEFDNDFLDLVNSDYGEICLTFRNMNNFKTGDSYFVTIYKNVNTPEVIKTWKNKTFKPFLKYLKKYKIKNV